MKKKRRQAITLRESVAIYFFCKFFKCGIQHLTELLHFYIRDIPLLGFYARDNISVHITSGKLK